MLPIPVNPVLLPELMKGLDRSLQHYVLQTKSGCGVSIAYLAKSLYVNLLGY